GEVSAKSVKLRVKLGMIECPSYVKVMGLVAAGILGGGGGAICVAAAICSFGVPLLAPSVAVFLMGIWGGVTIVSLTSFVIFLCFQKMDPEVVIKRETSSFESSTVYLKRQENKTSSNLNFELPSSDPKNDVPQIVPFDENIRKEQPIANQIKKADDSARAEEVKNLHIQDSTSELERFDPSSRKLRKRKHKLIRKRKKKTGVIYGPEAVQFPQVKESGRNQTPRCLTQTEINASSCFDISKQPSCERVSKAKKYQPTGERKLSNLSFVLFSSNSKEFAPQSLEFLDEVNGARDAVQLPENEKVKPKTQVSVPEISEKTELPVVVVSEPRCYDVIKSSKLELEHTSVTNMLLALPLIGCYEKDYRIAPLVMVLKLKLQSLHVFPQAKKLLKDRIKSYDLVDVYLIVYDGRGLGQSVLNYILHPWLFKGLTHSVIEKIEQEQAIKAVSEGKQLIASEAGVVTFADIGLFDTSGVTTISYFQERWLSVGMFKRQLVQIHTEGKEIAMSPNNAWFKIDRRRDVCSFYSVARAPFDSSEPNKDQRTVATFSIVINSTTEKGDGRTLMEAIRDESDLEGMMQKLSSNINEGLYKKIFNVIHPPEYPLD
ncbi:MAG: hypothetical protein KDK55_04425, partial [Chlamydiia bacterium]|nr:hypothetical protein [Chlamydiia bacterium]